MPEEAAAAPANFPVVHRPEGRRRKRSFVKSRSGDRVLEESGMSAISFRKTVKLIVRQNNKKAQRCSVTKG